MCESLPDMGQLDTTPYGVLFDLDGTLADTAPDLAAAVDEAMHALGLEACGIEQVRGWIGGGVAELARKALEYRLGRTVSAPELDHAVGIVAECYARHNGEQTRPFPGVDDALRRLQAADRATGCVTNKPSRFTLPLLERLGWTEALDVVVCGDRPAARKPRPELLCEAAAQLGLAVDELIFIGDSDHDVLAARGAGMRIAVVTYGYFRSGSVAALGADAVIADVSELFELFPALAPASRLRPA